MGSILNSAEVVDLLCLSEAIHRDDQSKKNKRKEKNTSDTISAKLVLLLLTSLFNALDRSHRYVKRGSLV